MKKTTNPILIIDSNLFVTLCMGKLEGLLIKEHRKAKGITQLELAEQLGISHAPIYHLENGKESVTIAKTRMILDAIGMELVIREKDG
jgi:HTH-type transcriptional regulator/antitoxin HipB